MGASANSEDPDEVPNETVFHQGLLCLLENKWSSGTEVHNFIEILTSNPLWCGMDNSILVVSMCME